MKDSKGRTIESGDRVKYSFNMSGIPVFTGVIKSIDGKHVIEHPNKVIIDLDESINYIEVISI